MCVFVVCVCVFCVFFCVYFVCIVCVATEGLADPPSPSAFIQDAGDESRNEKKRKAGEQTFSWCLRERQGGERMSKGKRK